jgi:NAD(P)H-hydrate epimerase
MLLLTADEMRRLDRATIERGHATGEALMERAGAGVAEAMERRYGSVLALRILVLSGAGNNGGDGFVAARHLHARGAHVHVGLLGARSRVQGDALLHLERMERDGVAAEPLGSESALMTLVGSHDAWDFALDAVLGTGARGAPEALAALAVQALRELDDAGTRVVAVDLPTGVQADTGEIAGGDPRGFPFTLATALEMAGRLPERDPRAHKRSVGRVLVVGGSTGLTGSVALSARAATRSGAGYVQLLVPESLATLYAIKLTEEMALPMRESRVGTLGLDALEPILERARSGDVMVLGPGLSRHADAAELARRLVARSSCPVVLDADGLNAFEGRTGEFLQGGATRVLTPHLGEMARLTGETAAALEARRLEAALEWAVRWKSVVVLKGAPTVTASPEGTATVNPTGNPGMATAGTGDVLSGVIAALIGQGLSAYDAARLGVFVHGLAGDQLAATRGPVGFAAGDLAEALPGALRELARVRDEARERQSRRPAR